MIKRSLTGMALLFCAPAAAFAAPPPTPNILLVIADDVGVDQSACYERPPATRAPQPHVEALCARGVTFTSAWANPFCSPTRAGMLTGRYSHRTGVGAPISDGDEDPALSTDEHTLPLALAAGGADYATGAFGKWHLANDSNGYLDHPNTAGFDHFAGTIWGHVEDFNEWPRTVNGVEETVTTYATTQTVDDAVEWITDQDGPWFAWVSFHAPHWPLHLPPGDLHSYNHLSGDEGDINTDPESYYQAMLEAVDSEMGRMFAQIGRAEMSQTIVIYVGDNGTQSYVNQDSYPEGHGKGSLYSGGVHVPLIVAGPGVVGRDRHISAKVNTVDIFETVLGIAGADPDTSVPDDIEIDSVSFAPYLGDPTVLEQREYLLAEVFGQRTGGTSAGQSITNGRFLLIRRLSGDEELYDRRRDPLEQANLLAEVYLPLRAAAAYEQLSDFLDLHVLDVDEAAAR